MKVRMSEKEKAKKGERRGGGRGTHGSITKSGKVRSQTLKVPKTSTKKHHGPLKTNRIKFQKFLRKEHGKGLANR